jgi:hypothetical protein
MRPGAPGLGRQGLVLGGGRQVGREGATAVRAIGPVVGLGAIQNSSRQRRKVALSLSRSGDRGRRSGGSWSCSPAAVSVSSSVSPCRSLFGVEHQ